MGDHSPSTRNEASSRVLSASCTWSSTKRSPVVTSVPASTLSVFAGSPSTSLTSSNRRSTREARATLLMASSSPSASPK